MTYKVIDIEGIGEIYANKLITAGIETVDQLLENTCTPRQRAELSEKTGISPKLILRWANHAYLFRIKGIGPQFAELLEASGVDTVKELRHRNAVNLAAKLEEVNNEHKLTRRVPSETELQKMIDEANAIEPALIY